VRASGRLGGALLAGALLLPAGAPRAGAEPTATAELVRIYQLDLLMLRSEGETFPFRLTGIDAVTRDDERLYPQALADVRRWTEHGPFVLLEAAHNTRGELAGHLGLADGTSLNERLVAGGHALVGPWLDRPSTRTEALRGAQALARGRRAGLWALKGIRPDKAQAELGHVVTMCGEVGFVTREAGGVWLLHTGEKYPRRDLTVRLLREWDPHASAPPVQYLRKDTCATGRLVNGALAPEIVVVDETQLREL
jgi:endonuclease YncB( thermonuclease family)